MVLGPVGMLVPVAAHSVADIGMPRQGSDTDVCAPTAIGGVLDHAHDQLGVADMAAEVAKGGAWQLQWQERAQGGATWHGGGLELPLAREERGVPKPDADVVIMPLTEESLRQHQIAMLEHEAMLLRRKLASLRAELDATDGKMFQKLRRRRQRKQRRGPPQAAAVNAPPAAPSAADEGSVGGHIPTALGLKADAAIAGACPEGAQRSAW
mmetsp:Transcript_62802/g.182160  ORF Transcript_62802/g.182160 Transcript_62802/m.182160 type:complete len:210 (+) Transcript_62802:93-722(+)